MGLTSRATGLGRRSGLGAARTDLTADRLAPISRNGWTGTSIGTSVEGRVIPMYSNAARFPRHEVMVVSAIHGDERGAGRVGLALKEANLPFGVSAHIIPIANPDGWVRGTRFNANNVDLNRNFPWWWQQLDGGPAPTSEPETLALIAAVQAVQPDLVIWIHQPLEYVAPIDPGTTRLATAWAEACDLPVRQGISQHGGGESWTYYEMGIPSILVEGTTREAPHEEIAAHQRGFEALLRAL